MNFIYFVALTYYLIKYKFHTSIKLRYRMKVGTSTATADRSTTAICDFLGNWANTQYLHHSNE